MGSRSSSGSKVKKILERLARAVNEWESEQYNKQKRKGQNERDQQR